jgi:TatD DNase family protein
MKHPRCVALGEIGLDYHYDNSPRDIQQSVFVRQLRIAVRLGKPLTIHTREAEDDTERILKAEIPKDHHVCNLKPVSFTSTDIIECGYPDTRPLFYGLA